MRQERYRITSTGHGYTSLTQRRNAMKNPSQAVWSRTTGWAAAVVALAAIFVVAPSIARAVCVGDCNGDGEVTVNELITMVNIALGTSPVSACMAGDANGDGEITVNEIVAGVNNALNGCPATAGTCGDGVTSGSEECDPGSVCIGGTNAGTVCTKESDCQGEGICDTFGQQGPPGTVPRKVCSADNECGGAKCIHCKRFGGNGCAVNCTRETEATINLVPGVVEGTAITPGTSGAIVFGDILTIPLPLSGTNKLLSGKVGTTTLGTPDLIPIAQKATGINLPRIPVSTLACACVRGSVYMTCGGTQFEADGFTVATNCTLPLCSVTKTMPCQTNSDCPGGETCVLEPCAGKKPCTAMNGPGNAGEGVIGCGTAGLPSVNYTFVQDTGGSTGIVGPAIFTAGAGGGAGSEVLASCSAIATVVGLCNGGTAAYGPDGEFCTDDDPFTARGVPSVTTLVTGTASGEVKNANGVDGNDIGPYEFTGNAISCDKVTAGMLTGGAQAGAFTNPAQPTVGDEVVTNIFVSQ